MIVCKKCNYDINRAVDFCPRCRAKLEFTEAEVRELAELYSAALANKEYESAVEYCRILASTGKLEFEREYGRMLERGELVTRDYDLAMRYFLSAAKKFDAWSAYRYSRLVSRGNDRAGRFWLLFSALLGCPEAYPKAASTLSHEGDERSANYYYIQAALHDDVDSIVELAGRLYRGEHIEKNESAAKWYLDKLTFPPLYALKLVYKLRSVKSRAPSEYIFDREPLIRSLTAEAAKCGFREAYYKLNTMLSELGDRDALTLSAMLLADGVGCTQNIDEAVRRFTEAAAQGSREAYICLAELFLTNEYESAEPELAIHYYEEAGKLGSPDAYEALGDLYESGTSVEKDLAKAEAYYSRARELGSEGAGAKADLIRRERDTLFRDALNIQSENPKRAFRAFAIAAAMGHKSAPLKLAECYLKGSGTEPDRYAAYYWFKTAAEGGDDKAIYPLALCYYNGVGINRDLDKAKKLFTKAARLGSEGAKRALSRLMESKKKKLSAKLYSKAMRLIYKKKYDRALSILELARVLGNAKAVYTLGTLHEFGLGTDTSRPRASAYYDESFRLGFMDTGSNYKRIILKLIR